MVVKSQEEAKKQFAEGFKDLFVNMFKNEFRKDIKKKQDEQIEMKLFDVGVKAGQLTNCLRQYEKIWSNYKRGQNEEKEKMKRQFAAENSKLANQVSVL